jgi:hypothetical protein
VLRPAQPNAQQKMTKPQDHKPIVRARLTSGVRLHWRGYRGSRRRTGRTMEPRKGYSRGIRNYQPFNRIVVLAAANAAGGWVGAGGGGGSRLGATATGATDGNPVTELGTLFELFGETSFETFGGKLRGIHSVYLLGRFPGTAYGFQTERNLSLAWCSDNSNAPPYVGQRQSMNCPEKKCSPMAAH